MVSGTVRISTLCAQVCWAPPRVLSSRRHLPPVGSATPPLRRHAATTVARYTPSLVSYYDSKPAIVHKSLPKNHTLPAYRGTTHLPIHTFTPAHHRHIAPRQDARTLATSAEGRVDGHSTRDPGGNGKDSPEYFRQLFKKHPKFHYFAPSAEIPGHGGVVLMFCWLRATRRYMCKYVELYTSRGAQVLAVTISPWDFLVPSIGAKVVVEELLELLVAHPTLRPCLIHAFSVGAYVYSEMMLKVDACPGYRCAVGGVVGTVWDCPVDVPGTIKGFPIAVCDVPIIRDAIELYIRLHLYVLYRVATIHYIEGRARFGVALPVPTLVLQGARDPVSTAAMMDGLLDGWRDQGVQVQYVCWSQGHHVQLYRHNPDEYSLVLAAFLDAVRFPSCLPTPRGALGEQGQAADYAVASIVVKPSEDGKLSSEGVGASSENGNLSSESSTSKDEKLSSESKFESSKDPSTSKHK